MELRQSKVKSKNKDVISYQVSKEFLDDFLTLQRLIRSSRKDWSEQLDSGVGTELSQIKRVIIQHTDVIKTINKVLNQKEDKEKHATGTIDLDAARCEILARISRNVLARRD